MVEKGLTEILRGRSLETCRHVDRRMDICTDTEIQVNRLSERCTGFWDGCAAAHT